MKYILKHKELQLKKGENTLIFTFILEIVQLIKGETHDLSVR